MAYAVILKRVEQYLDTFFHSHVNSNLLYHNKTHTETVVAAANRIATYYKLNDRDFFVVIVAAWFHDIGYFTTITNHEERGAEMAENFLKENGVDDDTIRDIKNCILATQMPQKPVTQLEKIVCDADLFHLGTDDFSKRNKLLRKETEMLMNKKIDKDEWRRGTIKLLETHQYHTDYCQSILTKKKIDNLEKLKHKERNSLDDRQVDPITALLHEHEEGEIDELEEMSPVTGEKKKKTKRPERGIDTVFRITSSNNQRLSNQADSKAHIMIQVNAIIISVLLSLLLRKIEDHKNLTIPSILLLTVNLVTIIFSILATRPNIAKGTFDKTDIEAKNVNLLFFGNFYKMTLQDYASGMLTMMGDSDFLYGSLIRDVYFQGVVLGRKYRLLRLSYNVFMFGLIVSVIAFVIASTAFPDK